MLKGNKTKQRVPMKQLRAASKEVARMLIDKRVIQRENVLEKIAQDSSKAILPGIPSYLPHRWTIEASRNAMFSVLRDWTELTKGDLKKQENISEFFRFVIGRVEDQNRKYKKEVKKARQEQIEMENKKGEFLSEVFSPLRKLQTARALMKFYIDSFAIFLIVHDKEETTTDYAEWFIGDWTPALYEMWSNKNKDDKKQVSE